MLSREYLFSLLIESNQVELYNYFRGDLLNHPDYIRFFSPYLTNYIQSDLFEEIWSKSDTSYMAISMYMDSRYIADMKRNNYAMFEEQFLTEQMKYIMDKILSDEAKSVLKSELFAENYDKWVGDYISEHKWVKKTFDHDFLNYVQSPKGKHYFTKVLPNFIFN